VLRYIKYEETKYSVFTNIGEELMILIYNRVTKEYEEEKIAGGGIIGMLYNTPKGKLTLEFLIKRKLFSALNGFLFDTRLSSKKIKGFIDEFVIDMSKCSEQLKDFKSFNHFFTRKQNADIGTFKTDPSLLLSPGDGRIRGWMNINMEQLVQVKGSTYSLKELIKEEKLANKYQGGICILLRLAPVDYHRFHFIDSGTCTETKKINGFYYSVNPIALNSVPEVFCRNKREYSILHSDNFGDIVYVEVGATSVGTIIQTYNSKEKVIRGDEKGYFKFGGSTIILFLEKGRAIIDEEILLQTEMGFETKVIAGESIGTCYKIT
jgi:phosphatidylserine decarboxylase